ncbi:MAG: cytochrome c oxidase subunit 3 [Thermoflexales bacterium]|nr:cytochrome c oxidase subunit 3 [Thermoflexales bacterium]
MAVIHVPEARRVMRSRERKQAIGLLGVRLFILSESMFFFGLFMAWFYLRVTRGGAWPPPGAQPPPFALAALNTGIALASAGAVLLGERAIARDQRRRLLLWSTVAAVLGVIFLSVQAVEFTELAQLARQSAYGSLFTFLLLFHALRVFAGVALLAVVAVRAWLGHFSARRRLMVQGTALYWYFITGIWLVVFAALYAG